MTARATERELPQRGPTRSPEAVREWHREAANLILTKAPKRGRNSLYGVEISNAILHLFQPILGSELRQLASGKHESYTFGGCFATTRRGSPKDFRWFFNTFLIGVAPNRLTDRRIFSQN